MLGPKALLGTALALYGLHAGAVPVRVALDWPAGMPASVEQIHLRATRVAGYTGGSVPVETEAKSEGMVLDLGDGVWQVQASVSGYWSQETRITASRQIPASVRLALWPAAFLHGEILTMDGEPLPHFLEVQLSAVADSASETSSPQISPEKSKLSPSNAELNCRIDQGTWTCLGPSGVFDLRVVIPGYAPHYDWGVSLKAAETTVLRRIELRRRASVFGRAVIQDGGNPPGPCRAILQPGVERHGGPGSETEGVPVDERTFPVSLTPRGYFQIVGIQPGRHVLYVTCPTASGLRDVQVQADGETRIEPPVQLEQLVLSIALTPKSDPLGQPWQLTVDTLAPHYTRIANKVTASDGRWIRRGLMAGGYRVTVSSSEGTSWLERDFDLDPRTGPLALNLASQKVAGRVLFSSEPVRARLVFFNDAGGEAVTLRSDDQGRFEGVLPLNADIPGASWTVEAHVAQPKVSQRLLGISVPRAGEETPAWLDLEIPAVAVRGSVVSKDGKPQRGIQVSFENSNGIRTSTGTNDAGDFEMPDLPPGKYTAMAESSEGVSDRTPFEVSEGRGSDVKLVLNAFERIPFYVLSSQGPVADAAVQIWRAPGIPLAFAHTDQDGRFEVKLPPGITELGVTVGASGYALKMIRVPISPAPEKSSDANTITLDQSGGRLVLNFQPPDHVLDSSAVLYLVHDGVLQDAHTIAGWGTDQVGTSGYGPATVDSIDPGVYALCVLSDPAQASALRPGALPPDLCTTGSVEQGGTLTLSPR